MERIECRKIERGMIGIKELTEVDSLEGGVSVVCHGYHLCFLIFNKELFILFKVKIHMIS